MTPPLVVAEGKQRDLGVGRGRFHVIFLIRPQRKAENNVFHMVEGSLEVKLPTIWTDEKQSREEAERRERLEERRVEEKE